MLHILKPLHCPSCNAVYCSREIGRPSSQTKNPVILPCSHSICYSCLSIAVKNQKDFSCPLCKVPVDLSSGNESLSKLLPDLYALGILNAQKKQALPSFKVKMVSNPEMYKNVNKLAKKICDQCHQVEALWQCDECQSYFCNLCFDQVHRKIKSRRKHEAKKIFAELYNTMVQTGCPEHKNKSVEFYCEKDDQLTCSHCMLIGSHVGHEVKTLVDKNKSCAKDLKDLLVDISEIEKRLRYTEHLLMEVSTSEKVDVSEYIKRIHDHFHKLHSLLEVREAKLISQLEDIANLQNEPFEKMVFEISGYQKEINSIKRDAESVIENPCLAISAPNLLKKLESFKEIPCYLLPIQDNVDKKFKIELQLNNEFENDVEKHGSIEYNIKPRFHLVPTQELPEKYCMDIPESFVQSVSEVDSQSNATLDSCSEDSLMSPGSTKSNIEAAFKYRDINRMHPEVVMVSHIKDPSCFWVQRCADSRKLTSLSESINKFCRTRDLPKASITIERGDLYLVQFSEDKKWYRGRVKRILEPGETYEIPVGGIGSIASGHKIIKNNEALVEVFYIDYGNTEIVPIARLRNIQTRFLNLPGLAKHCSLVDIVPANEDKWSEEAIKTFRRFVQRKQVIMQIYEERNNVCLVDLSQVADNSITNDVPVSIRDALVFQELAVFPSGNIIHSHRKHSEQQYLPPERLRLNADIAVIVSHVDSPSHFYVQQISTAAYLSSLIFEMSDTYCQENNSLLQSIYAPRVGMICAAQFSVDKQWYRAQVISLPGGANVEVQYVDFGNTEIIHHKFIRKLSDKFKKLNIQAIPCKLADVTYNQEKFWSPEAKEWLTSKVSKKQLTLRSNGFDLGEKKSEVVIFYIEDEYEICVNALLVEAGLASSCGPESTTVTKKIEVSVPAVEQSPIERILSYESVEDLITSPIAAPVAQPQPALAKKFPESEGHHLEVHVSHIVNPSEFYIRFAGNNEKKLEKLMNEMQKTYTNFEGQIKDCIVGRCYAVYSNDKRKWFRGAVLSKSDDHKIKVHFADYGFDEEVPIKNVQKLMEIFAVEDEYSLCCELSGIIPAGGSTVWSHAACDAFCELIHPHETLHISFKGEIDKEKAIPVNLFIEEIKIGGALEATEVIYKNVASELVACGLALPVRNTSKSPCKSSQGCEPEASELCDTVPKVSISNDDCKTEIPQDKNEEKQEIVSIEPVQILQPTCQWKQVHYPIEPKFKGFVTNIGDDGCIQLHQVREGASVVEMIKKALQFKYAKSDFKPLVKPPPVGEACVAKFSLDNLWYRAEVIAVYPEKVKVNFVDYGNNEIVLLSNVRTDIIMQNFPRQCMECTIAGIHTGKPGQWDDDLLNFLHSQLVETIIEVEPLGPPDKDGKLICNMVTNCGISVAELLQSMGFMESGVEVTQVDKTFRPATELREGDIFPVCITQINSPNIVYLQRLKIPEPKSDYEKEFNNEHEAFLELIKELQEKAETFPIVEEPMPGLACCAKYSYDGNWYRCEVTDLLEEGVAVLYVDYGNSETITSENLRDPDDHIIDFPVQVHFCKIHGMSPMGDEWDPEVKKFMIEKLLDSGLEIFARVVIPDKISHIDLLVKSDTGELKLAYEELVDRKLISLQGSQEC